MPPARTSKLTWAQARVATQAADEQLRRALLAVPGDARHAKTLHAFADRILPFDEDEIPVIFKRDYALPDYTDPRLFLTPFTTRIQPPRTVPLPDIRPQSPLPSHFKPQDLSDLLTPQGNQELLQFYDALYHWLLLVDEWSVRIPRNMEALSRRLEPILCAPVIDKQQLAAVLSLDEDAMLDRVVHLWNSDMSSRLPPNPGLHAANDATAWLWSIIEDRTVSKPGDPTEDEIVQLLLAARPEPLALGPSRFVKEARGKYFDLRTLPPQLLDYAAPLQTELDLDFIRRWKLRFPTWPDQEIFCHLLKGVRFKAPMAYQMVIQPHLASLPLGYFNVHKELKRLVDRSFFTSYANIPFAPWQTLPMGVAFRKLEPDRPRRTTDGGSPRRGRKAGPSTDGTGDRFVRRGGAEWLVDTDGNRVMPINVGSRWPEDDVRRGTLDTFYEAWQKALTVDRSGSPPPFHPLSTRFGSQSPRTSRPVSPAPMAPVLPIGLTFSGLDTPDGLGADLRRGGFRVDLFDILLDPKQDALVPSVAAQYLAKARNGDFSFCLIASPCKFFSVGASDRPVLFSREHPLGVPSPPSEWAAYLLRGRQIILFVEQLILALDGAGTPWVLENPSRRHRKGTQSYWEQFAEWGTLFDALEHLGVPSKVELLEVEFAQCALQAPYQKFTTFWASMSAKPVIEAFENLPCPHRERRIPHARRLRGFDQAGLSVSAAAAAYPHRCARIRPNGTARRGAPFSLSSSARSQPYMCEHLRNTLYAIRTTKKILA